MKKLIINADDFALHSSINSAIIQAYTKGVLTSTSILANGPAFMDAVGLAKNHPGLSLGAHLCLVGGLEPITAKNLIPTLLDPTTNCFYENYLLFIKNYFLKKINPAEIELELANQIQHILAQNLQLTHLDSHQHLHVLPGINDIVIKLAKKNDIARIRVPNENCFFTGIYPFTFGRFLGRMGLSFFAKISAQHFQTAELAYPGNFFGMLAGGNLQEQYFINIIDNLQDGTNEIMIHPGANNTALNEHFSWQYHWESELQALTSKNVAKELQQQNIKLISFKDL